MQTELVGPDINGGVILVLDFDGVIADSEPTRGQESLRASREGRSREDAYGREAFWRRLSQLVGRAVEELEVRWQLDRMTVEVRACLRRLPLLGEDSSGPLGAGLLASGMLAMTIREIQAELASSTAAA